MRILIAADMFPPDPAGPATYAANIANSLLRLGVDISIVSLNSKSDHSRVNCALYKVGYTNKVMRYLNYSWLLFKHSNQVDLIYAMGPVNAGLPAMIVAKLRGKKLVVKVVGDYAWEQGIQRFGVKDLIDEFQKRRDYRWPVMILKFIESMVAKTAHKVIVPSVYLKNIVQGWGVTQDNIEVVYNAVEKRDISKMYKGEEELWIVSIGRLTPWKGMDTLIKLMPEFIKVFPELKLKIISAGPEHDNLIKLIQTLGLQGSVELLGALPYEHTMSYIKSADVFVLNSAYEGMPHVVLEALVYNKPVAVSRCGGNTELVQMGVGELFEYNNELEIKEKIVKLLEDPGQFIERQNSYEWKEFFKQFDFSYMVNKSFTVLSEVCQS